MDVLFSNDLCEKKTAMNIPDSDFLSNDHLKSGLFEIGLECYIHIFCFSCSEEEMKYFERKKVDSPDFIPPPSIRVGTPC